MNALYLLVFLYCVDALIGCEPIIIKLYFIKRYVEVKKMKEL